MKIHQNKTIFVPFLELFINFEELCLEHTKIFPQGELLLVSICIYIYNV